MPQMLQFAPERPIASWCAALLIGAFGLLLTPAAACQDMTLAELPPKPEPPRRPAWTYAMPSVGVTQGPNGLGPTVSFNLGGVMNAVFAWQQFKYADELREWSEQRELLKREQEHQDRQYQRELLALELEKAEHDSLYYDQLLKAVGARFQRGDAAYEQLLSAQNAMYQATWTARRLRVQIRQLDGVLKRGRPVPAVLVEQGE